MPVGPGIINGKFFSMASLDLKVGPQGQIARGVVGPPAPVAALDILGFKAANYDDSIQEGDVRGGNPIAFGYTRGVYNSKFDLTLYRGYSDDFIAAITLGKTIGKYEAIFSLILTYEEPGLEIGAKTDKLFNCRLLNNGHSNSQGTGATEVKFSGRCQVLIPDGVLPFSPESMPAGLPTS